MKKFRSYPVRFCFKLVCIIIAGLIGTFAILNTFSYITDRKDVWWRSFVIAAVVVIVILILVCIIIASLMRKKVYYINYNEKFIREGNKTICYELVEYIKCKHTITHRLFGLVTIKVKGPYGRVVLRDVPEKIEDYIKGEY